MESIKLSFTNKDLNLLKGCVYIDYDPKDCIIDICTGEDKGSCTGIDLCHIDHSDCENIDQCVQDVSGGCFDDFCTLNDEDHCWGSDTTGCASNDSGCAANDAGCSGNDNCWWDSCNMDSTDHCHGAG